MAGRRILVVTSRLLVLIILIAPALLYQPTYAVRGLLNRSLTLSDSEASANAAYDFQFDIGLNQPLGSIRFEFCSNHPIPFLPCTAPSGFDISGATLIDQSGETGFVIDPSTTANDLLLTRVPAAATPQTVSYTFDQVVNPDTKGSYFVRLYTFSSSDGSGPTIEENGIAFAITDTFDVTAEVPPTLQFCVGLSITANDCSTALGNLIDFGILGSSGPNVATSQMAGGTNGVGGMAISVLGTTMTAGIHTIPALQTRGLSVPGSGQFGINLRDNAVPNAGQNPSGPGTTVPLGDYNVPNEFVFNDGDVVAASPISTDFNTLTATYLVNVVPDQKPGIYTATITFVATATF